MDPLPARRRARVVATLGASMTLNWASSFYLPAVLAVPMARDLGLAPSTVFGLFSLALLVSALLGPWAGRLIDRRGGRPVLIATNLVFAAGLATLAFADGTTLLAAGWLLIGIGMGTGLYEAGFATLVRYEGHHARNAITGITLIAGFASTIGWPLSAVLDAQIGWRGACQVWALLHLVPGLLLNLSLPRAAVAPGAVPGAPETVPGAPRQGEASAAVALPPDSAATRMPTDRERTRIVIVLAYVLAANWFVATAMASHLPRLLETFGTDRAAAVAAGALIGPAQVAARLLEFGLLRRLHPLLSARIACLGHPLAAAVLALVGSPAAMAFTVLHGGGNGLMTVAKGTLPLALFGPVGYGRLQGLVSMPSRFAQALSPFLFGVLLDRLGSGVLWVSAALTTSAFVALLALRTR